MNRTMSLAEPSTGELLTLYQHISPFETGKVSAEQTSTIYLAHSEPLISASTQFPTIGNDETSDTSSTVVQRVTVQNAGTNPRRPSSSSGVHSY